MNKDKPKQEINQKPIVKFVKKAGQWCRTYWEHGVQKQSWSQDKPKER